MQVTVSKNERKKDRDRECLSLRQVGEGEWEQRGCERKTGDIDDGKCALVDCCTLYAYTLMNKCFCGKKRL